MALIVFLEFDEFIQIHLEQMVSDVINTATPKIKQDFSP
jgi:hypothetical protein